MAGHRGRRMSVIVVTGGFGYVGGRVVREFMNNGAEVRVATRRTHNAVPDWAGKAVRFSSDVAALADGADCLIHLAAPNEVVCAAAPEKAIADTVALTQSAIEAARAGGVGRVIYFSTVHVYGPLQGHIDETTPAAPQNPYAEAHLLSEDIVQAAAGPDLQAVSLRLSNGFGAPADTGTDRWSLLINDLCRQAVRERTMTLKSDGRQMRDFLPLTDVARAARHAASAAVPPGVYNLSSGKSTSIRAMAELILDRARQFLGDDVALIAPSIAPGPSPEMLTIDNHRLGATGFHPKTDPADEIDTLLRFCRDADAPKR